MTDAISDRARMSTGGDSSDRAAAATFAEYDREDDLRAAGADAPTDEGRLSESLQQKEVGVATSLQDAQVQLDNLRGSTALTSMKLEVASALHPEEEPLIEGFSTAAALAMPEIQDAMKAWFPELTETFIHDAEASRSDDFRKSFIEPCFFTFECSNKERTKSCLQKKI